MYVIRWRRICSFYAFFHFMRKFFAFYVKHCCLLCSSPVDQDQVKQKLRKKPRTGDAVLSGLSLNKTQGCVTFLFVLLTCHRGNLCSEPKCKHWPSVWGKHGRGMASSVYIQLLWRQRRAERLGGLTGTIQESPVHLSGGITVGHYYILSKQERRMKEIQRWGQQKMSVGKS